MHQLDALSKGVSAGVVPKSIRRRILPGLIARPD
jgi:hypothetical protein